MTYRENLLLSIGLIGWAIVIAFIITIVTYDNAWRDAYEACIAQAMVSA